MINPEEIIDTFYAGSPALRALLLTHSSLVACKAREAAIRSGQDADLRFIHEAARLHDIGIIHTDAPGILCEGTEPYIRHGVIGRDMLDSLGLHAHALVCERHTGSGLTAEDIISRNLPLPHRDLCPISIEEKAICYTDKFYSKSGDPTKEKTLEQVRAEMARFGEMSLARFDALHSIFGN